MAVPPPRLWTAPRQHSPLGLAAAWQPPRRPARHRCRPGRRWWRRGFLHLPTFLRARRGAGTFPGHRIKPRGPDRAGLREQPEHPLIIVQAFTSEAVPADARAALREHGERGLRDVVALVQEGQAAGQVAAGDPVELARALLATVQGVALARLQGEPFSPGTETVLRILHA